MRKTRPCGSNVTTSPKVGLGWHPGAESQRALAEWGGGDTSVLSVPRAGTGAGGTHGCLLSGTGG